MGEGEGGVGEGGTDVFFHKVKSDLLILRDPSEYEHDVHPSVRVICHNYNVLLILEQM